MEQSNAIRTKLDAEATTARPDEIWMALLEPKPIPMTPSRTEDLSNRAWKNRGRPSQVRFQIDGNVE